MLLLALDTSSTVVTVAVHDGHRVLAELSTTGGQQHAEQLTPSIFGVLQQAGVGVADLTGVVVGVGPGPFTGLRVGVVTARTLGYALGVPVFGVCSHDGLAERALRLAAPGERFIVATDARRREVYWAQYDVRGGVAERLGEPQVGPAAAVPRRGLPVVGRGAALYPELLGPAHQPLDPCAGALATVAARALAEGTLAEGVALLEPEPLYLRRPDAAEPGAPKRVSR